MRITFHTCNLNPTLFNFANIRPGKDVNPMALSTSGPKLVLLE